AGGRIGLRPRPRRPAARFLQWRRLDPAQSATTCHRRGTEVLRHRAAGRLPGRAALPGARTRTPADRSAAPLDRCAAGIVSCLDLVASAARGADLSGAAAAAAT